MGHLTIPTLVLNKAWQPIAVATVRRAVVQVAVDSAKFLDENYMLYDLDSWLELPIPDGEEGISLAHGKFMRIPEIMVLTSYDKFPEREVKLTRRNLLVRDRYTCQYTGMRMSARDATIDHVMPQSRGGGTTWDNVVICSVDANRRKADKTPEEAGMKLLTKPAKPAWNPAYSKFARLSATSRVPDSWKKFLPKNWDMQEYWDIEIQE
tara:strand:+ start:227586 stop:228209 length:624 start_codon:yes stop_codon:yes gene_type:complete